MSVDWNNYSMKRQMPMGPVSPPPAASPTPAPAPANPFASSPFGGLLNGIFGPNGMAQSHPLGGLLGMTPLGFLFNRKQPEPAKKTVIDQRPDDVQRLVSMFSNPGGQ